MRKFLFIKRISKEYKTKNYSIVLEFESNQFYGWFLLPMLFVRSKNKFLLIEISFLTFDFTVKINKHLKQWKKN